MGTTSSRERIRDFYQQSTMRDALVAWINLQHLFNNHAERVKMANIAQIINVLQP